jgi:hypothetical protein
MYIKITKSKNFKYAQLVRSYREDGKIKHEVLIKFGRLDHLENNPAWQKIAMKLGEIAGANSTNIDTGALPVFSSFLYDESAYTGQKLHQKFHYIESIAISTLHSH